MSNIHPFNRNNNANRRTYSNGNKSSGFNTDLIFYYAIMVSIMFKSFAFIPIIADVMEKKYPKYTICIIVPISVICINFNCYISLQEILYSFYVFHYYVYSLYHSYIFENQVRQ